MKAKRFLLTALLFSSAALCFGSQLTQNDPELLTQAYLQAMSKTDIARMNAYWIGNHWLLLWNMVSAAAVAWLFLSAGLSSKVQRIGTHFKSNNIKVLLFAGLYFVLDYALSFPLHVYQGFVREQHYNFSNQTFAQWLSDDLAQLMLTVLFVSPLIVIIYAIMRRAKRFWWLWAAGISLVFLVIGLLVYPIYIRPLFNQYSPLKEGPVRDKIVALARATNIPVSDIYVYDESRQTKRPSADVSGFAGSTRISVNDNLINRCTPAEITAVIAHEMGHYVKNHIYKLLAAFGLLTIIGFWFIDFMFGRLIRIKKHWPINGPQDVNGLPLFLFLLSFYFFLLTPITNSIVRVVEKEADEFSFEWDREPDGFASYFVKSADYNRIAPGYWEEVFFYDHPSVKNRIYSAMKWKVEHNR